MTLIETIKLLPIEERIKIINEFDDDQLLTWYYDWDEWARPEQHEPQGLGENNKFIWFAKCGRGFGKTRMFAEWFINKIKNHNYKYTSIVGATADEVRTIMIEGESGLLACADPLFYPAYEPSKKLIVWPNGARTRIFYGSEPDKSRGAQSDLIWGDEYCKWKYPQETLDNLLFGLRLGQKPLCGISSTPKPTKAIKDLINNPNVIVTGGNTFDNIRNLADPFIKTIIAKYKGTRLEQQEVYAKLLDDNPNALWRREWIDRDRIVKHPDLKTVIIGIDPAVSHDEESSNETGIVAVGSGPALDGMRFPELTHYYVLDDRSLIGTPDQWARASLTAYHTFKADKLVPEKNNGGDMVTSTIRNVDKNVKIKPVWASRGKVTRAEPISALYEQGRVHHVGSFPDLEDELCEWVPGEFSPNRLDALVWAITALSERFEPAFYDANGKRIA